MKRGEKSEEGIAEKKENLGVKVRKRVLVGKRAGPSTPSPAWRLGPAQDSIIVNKGASIFSARKLAATLWEIHHFLPLAKMHRGGGGGGPLPPPPLKLRHRHHLHYRDKGLDLPTLLADPFPTSPDQMFWVLFTALIHPVSGFQLAFTEHDLAILHLVAQKTEKYRRETLNLVPASASSLRRHVATTLMQHRRANERNSRALQPVSPASYGSSLESCYYLYNLVTNCPSTAKPSVPPTFASHISSVAFFLQVLNRIWSLEEQHASNVSLIKALKMELGHARARIKRLLRDQQAERHEIDDLMKQVEDKLLRKVVRNRTESILQFKLEKERKSRELLEDLCDEFAKGIRDYQQEVHALKQKSDSDWAGRADHDRLILHLSESWLDERMQTKLVETQLGSAENNPILDKLSFEIETFLQAKQMHTSKTNSNMLPREPTKERYLRRNSLESVPLHDAVSAPQDAGDEEASAGSDTNCFELNKPTTSNFKPHGDEPEAHTDRMIKSKKKLVPHERIKGRNPSSLQVKFEEQMARAMACNGNKTTQVVDTDQQRKISEGIPLEASITPKPENCEATEDRSYEERLNTMQ
ncbi:Uncharacterized protein CK203_089703 [Vitis vinifera]|uniref:Uncharacterized protein n=1 Tax=Vitis vinifera TaxID=29760 RepID=A0A438E620_VITVI|nr:Uncharacterized protein CK203_089703 [Vitis vinifera]